MKNFCYYDGQYIPIFDPSNQDKFYDYECHFQEKNHLMDDNVFLPNSQVELKQIDETKDHILSELEKGRRSIEELSGIYPHHCWSNAQENRIKSYQISIKHKINNLPSETSATDSSNPQIDAEIKKIEEDLMLWSEKICIRPKS